jgi:hypothetical protein
MVYYTPTLYGGLGNQLFQIFSIMGMAKRDNVDFKLCKKYIDNFEIIKHSRRNTHFDNFLIKLTPFFIDEIENYVLIEQNLKVEDHFPFVKNYYRNLLFKGFFQNYYFLDLLGPKIIKEYLNFPNKDLSKYNLENAFFIHYRRGDYVNNNFHDILSEDYYIKALKEYPEDATILICSNENNFGINKPYLQNRNVIFIYEDEVTTLLILSLCKWGGICANSSFSWWGTYLNESPDKIVCMPFIWFNIDNEFMDGFYYKGVKKIVYEFNRKLSVNLEKILENINK